MLLRNLSAMDSVSAAKKGFGGAYKDRISELPDEILILILSFVFSAKDVKRTCILSKRWRNVWAFVPSLEFRHLLTTDGEGFVGFVDNFLQLRNPSDLHTLSLDVRCDKHNLYLGHVEEWICYAARNNVKLSSDTIKRLEMCNWEDPKIRIIPRPTSLINTNVIFSLGNLPCLVSATIKYDNPDEYEFFGHSLEDDDDDDDDDDVSPINPKLISGLSNATNLDLFMATCKHIPEAKLSKLPTFHNLRSLKLGGWSTSKGNSQILVHFLRCSPNLEELGLEYDEILQLPKSGEVGFESFDCPCLEKVEIKVPRWSNPQVHELVKFLHEHAKKLLKINIVYDRSYEGIEK